MAITLERLWLTDFRNYAAAELALGAGTTAIIGANGQGKTNILEAIGHIAGTTVRGAQTEAMIRLDADRAIVRAQGHRGHRELLVESELVRHGRNRMQLNRQPVRRQRDLLEAFAVTVFSPDDLALVKEGPSGRRSWLDDAVVGLDPQRDADRAELDRILRQRNALLRQAKGRLEPGVAVTLDVWDERLVTTGSRVVTNRLTTLRDLAPRVETAYRDLAGHALAVRGVYEAEWLPAASEPDPQSVGEALGQAVRAARDTDVRRGVTTVGPHRDEIAFTIDGRPARTHASQGEQRSLALGLRLAVHRAAIDATGEAPILLLDDVLSELDEQRATALLDHLPPGQTLLTTAGLVPDRARPERVVRIERGTICGR